ncbi:MAG: response regulator [Desulfobacterales bacterium]|nr:response regulator [Desulfobacterales bacterium]
MKKILLVDDSRLVRNSIKIFFKALGYSDINFLEAKDGQEALDIFTKEMPDMIILDLLMPIMGGEDLVKHIQTTKHNCFISIMSSNFQKPVRERLLGMGANLFVEKPVTPEKLSLIIADYKTFKGI